MEPVTLISAAILNQLQTSNFIGSLVGGIIGNRADALLCDGVKKIYNNIKNNWDKPGNHDIQKAVRNSYLKATLMAVKNTQSKYSFMDNLSLYNPSCLRDIESYIKGELDLLKKGNVQFQPTVFDEAYQPLISPAGDTASARLPEMIAGLKESMFHELTIKGLSIEQYLREAINTGWEEKGKTIDWYELTCAFFTDELKTNTRLSIIIQTDYLRDISNDMEGVTVSINKIESDLEVFFQDHQALLPKVDEILAHVIGINEKVDQLPDTIRVMLREERKNFAPDLEIPDFTLDGRYQALIMKIKSLNREESEIRLEIQDLRIELGEASVERKERLKRILTRTESMHIELAEQRQQTETDLQDFVSSVLKLAEQFAQQEGHITPRLEKARELFRQGQFEDVDEVLNEMDIYADIETLLERAEELADELMVKAQATVVNKKEGWYRLADKYYAEAAALNLSYNTCFDYAYFLSEHKQVLQAAFWYEKSLLFVEDKAQKSNALNNLANLQYDMNEFEKAEAIYSEALEIRRELAASNQQVYLSDVAATLYNLANLQYDKNEFDKAEKNYSNALEIRRQLALSDPQASLFDITMILHNLARLQHAKNEFDKAETNYLKALEIRKQLATSNPQAYHSDVAKTLNGLGLLQYAKNEFDKAEKNYLDALEIFRELALSNPQSYLADVAMILNNLGGVQHAKNEFGQAEANYSESLRIYKKLAASNPQTYLSVVATILNNLASLQGEKKQFDKAEIHFSEALQIRRELTSSNPQVYLSDVAQTLNNLALLQRDKKEFDQAEINYSEALEIYRELAASNPQRFNIDYGNTASGLAVLYRYHLVDKQQSIFYAKEAIDSFSPFLATVPFAAKWKRAAEEILVYWEEN